MQPIAHFSAGLSVAILLFFIRPELFPELIRYDIFYALAFGLFAMLPDIGGVFGDESFDDKLPMPICNLFIFHRFFDDNCDDKKPIAALFVAVAVGLTYVYFGRI